MKKFVELTLTLAQSNPKTGNLKNEKSKILIRGADVCEVTQLQEVTRIRMISDRVHFVEESYDEVKSKLRKHL